MKKQIPEIRLTVGEHLEELRSCLFRSLFAVGIGFIFSYVVSDRLLALLLAPVLDVLGGMGLGQFVVQTSVAEKFLVHIKVSLLAGILLASPAILWQTWCFVGVALHPNERRYVLAFLPASALSFLAGILFFYLILPWGLQFLLGFGAVPGAADPIRPFLKISELVGFLVSLALLFGVVFQLPLGMLLLNRIGLISAEMLREKRRFAILGAFVVGSILTPPDIVTQVVLAIPVCLLYEVGIFLIHRRDSGGGPAGGGRLDFVGIILAYLPSCTVLILFGMVWVGRGVTPLSSATRTPEEGDRHSLAVSALIRELGMESEVSALPELRYRWVQDVGQGVRDVSDDALQRLLEREIDPGIRLRIAMILARRGQSSGFDYLMKSYRSKDTLISFLAGRILQVLSGKNVQGYGATIPEREKARKALEAWWNEAKQKESEGDASRNHNDR
ncbi:MAG: twin-arginine translocase subunit TatC [Planctomycetota bacterium]|jgi:sec-independent protein translocase protein TatC|nr:twin-arginine translocase subunit TatC [Planctomycetota bacterium]